MSDYTDKVMEIIDLYEKRISYLEAVVGKLSKQNETYEGIIKLQDELIRGYKLHEVDGQFIIRCLAVQDQLLPELGKIEASQASIKFFDLH